MPESYSHLTYAERYQIHATGKSELSDVGCCDRPRGAPVLGTAGLPARSNAAEGGGAAPMRTAGTSRAGRSSAQGFGLHDACVPAGAFPDWRCPRWTSPVPRFGVEPRSETAIYSEKWNQGLI